jgi:hypothetical protein
MKKIFAILLVCVLFISTTCFAASSTIIKQPKLTTINGVVAVDKNVIKLKTSKDIYVLTGKTKGMDKLKGKNVQVKGYLKSKKFNVVSFSNVTKNVSAPKPTVPAKPPTSGKVPVLTLTGMLTQNAIEGVHFELNVDGKIYVLEGLNDDLSKYAGKMVKIEGWTLENPVTIYQRGILLKVYKIEVVSDNGLGTNEQRKMAETLVGTVMVDKITGTHIGFQVGEELYGLTGYTDGLETLDGKKVEVIGYTPNIQYIRKPDFIMFEVSSFKVAE